MNDCIERKKAIELIQPHVKPQTVYGEGYLQAIEHATDILELMPAADVQPVKRGHWIYNDAILNRIKCSECGFWSDDLQADNFCPCCGADMRGDTECQ